MKKITWTRRNKILAGLGGLGVVLAAVLLLVFTFVGIRLFMNTMFGIILRNNSTCWLFSQHHEG